MIGSDRSQYVILDNMKSYATPVLLGVSEETILVAFYCSWCMEQLHKQSSHLAM